MPTSQPRSRAEPLLGGGPARRPSLLLRVPIAMGGMGATMFSAALLLSDRAPSVLRSLFGERVNGLWERVDRGPIEIRSETASQPDFVVHVLIWAVVTALVVLAAWSWRALPPAAGCVAVSSLALELAQGRWSSTREVERSDALANLVGVGTGTVVAAIAMLGWSAVAVAFGETPDRSNGPLV